MCKSDNWILESGSRENPGRKYKTKTTDRRAPERSLNYLGLEILFKNDRRMIVPLEHH